MDLRIPSGLFFVALAAILLGLGLSADRARAALTDANVNLYSGLAMLIFGSILLSLAYRKK